MPSPEIVLELRDKFFATRTARVSDRNTKACEITACRELRQTFYYKRNVSETGILKNCLARDHLIGKSPRTSLYWCSNGLNARTEDVNILANLF